MSTSLLPNSSSAMGDPFTPEQQSYLDGFFSGIRNRGLSFGTAEPEAGPQPLADEKKKIPEERMKDELHPFDAFPRIRAHARDNNPPEKEDVFRFKWNGLFWLAPVHEGYMCRLRIPGGQMSTAQFRAVADCAEELASGYGQLTTRNNLQIRIIQPKDAPELLRRIQDAGLHSRGSGADNLRNFTANPTAGIDPYELIDVSPYIRELSHSIMNGLEFYNLPRKFNISFDGGGLVGVAEDTNDIGLRAVKLREEEDEKVWFQIMLGGVTGHKEFAEHAGVICGPEDAVEVTLAMTRVYIRNGNRTSRGKSRLLYLLKDWGFEKFLEETEKLLPWKLRRFSREKPEDAALIVPHERPTTPHSHVGVYPQKQEGLNYIGVYVPVGLMPCAEMRAIADISDQFGDGTIRLTIFQNLILSGIPDDKVDAARQALAEAGLKCEASNVRGGVAACTGNRYCKFASSDTKGNAMDLVEYLEKYITLDQPINIHVTGCPHSCAQHYIGDIGLLACKVQQGEGVVEGYHVFVGGGFGENKNLGRQLFKSIAAGRDLHERVLGLLTTYLALRKPNEKFVDFASRFRIEDLERRTLEKLEEMDAT